MQQRIKQIAYNIITAILRNQTRRLIKHNPKMTIIAITGSVGKTTTKIAVATILKQKYRVMYHEGNYNTRIGLPLSLFNLESPGSVLKPVAWTKLFFQIEKKLRQPYPYDVAVMEMGADAPGHIGEFMEFIHPDYGIVTATMPSHLEGFLNIENIKTEKFKLALGSKVALLNADDKRLMSMLPKINRKKVVLYGVDKGDYRFEVKNFRGGNGFDGTLVLKGQRQPVKLKVIAKHNIHALVAAAAIADIMGFNPTEIKKGIEAIHPVNGRMNYLRGVNATFLIDDSYNSSPEAVTAALDTLYSFPGRKIAVLGMMNEMNGYSREYHEMVGRYAAKVDLLVTVGKDSRAYILPAAIKAGLEPMRTKSFKDPWIAGKWLKTQLKRGDRVLVKGSQGGVFLEETVALMLADKKDKKKLVRQSPFWMRVKKAANYE